MTVYAKLERAARDLLAALDNQWGGMGVSFNVEQTREALRALVPPMPPPNEKDRARSVKP